MIYHFRGATQSKLVIFDETGKKYGEWEYGGLNYVLDGFDIVADKVAAWTRKVKREIGISAPFAALVRIWEVLSECSVRSKCKSSKC